MTACEQAIEAFSALLDGELPAEEADVLDRHLAACEACRHEARRLAVLNRLTLETVVQDYLKGRKGKPAAPKRTTRRALPPPPNRRPVWFVAAAAAAILVAALLVRSARNGDPAPDPAAALAARKADEVRMAEQTKRQRERERVEAQARLAELERKQKQLQDEKKAEREKEAEAQRLAAERRKLEEELARQKQAEAAAEAALEKAEEERRKAEAVVKAEAARVKPDRGPRPSTGTRAEIGRILSIAGEAFLITETGRVPAKAGQGLISGTELETGSSLSWAILAFEDNTRLEVASGTRVKVAVGDDGKRVFVQHGLLTADVAKQPVGKPMIFASAHGEAKVLGTSLRIVVDPDPAKGSIRVDVDEGRVQVKRALDGKTVDVPTGTFAVAGAGVEFKTVTMPSVLRRKRPVSAAVDAKVVDDAIWRGIASLREPMAFDHWNAAQRERMIDFYEITLLALIEAGVPERDPLFEGLLQRITTMPFKSTYHTALQAIILEQVHRVKYQVRIAECAQYLVDNQMKDGQWDLGEPTPLAHKEWTPPSNVKEFNPFLPINQREKPAISRRLAVMKRREGRRPDGRPFGDNVQSIWAALGLRACVDAGVNVDSDVIQKGARWWRDNNFTTGGDPAATGWGDQGRGQGEPNGYVTAGAAEALIFYDRVLGVDWTKDKAVAGALKWLQANWTVTEVPKAQDPNVKNKVSEYLWAVERVAGLCAVEKFDTHDWYAEGAKAFLSAQEPAGSWERGQPHPTSIAVLFLKRGTRSLAEVASDRR